jgi:hypothetical protein
MYIEGEFFEELDEVIIGEETDLRKMLDGM